MPYPVTVHVEPAPATRNRLTTAFRLILAIPHLILVGGAGFGVSYSGDTETSAGAEGGLLGAVVLILAIVSWFTILASGRHIAEIRQFTSFYMRWRTRALAYLMLLADPYPPFGDVPYPASISIDEPQEPRNRVSVAFRLFLAIPHFIVLVFVMLAWYCHDRRRVGDDPGDRPLSEQPVRVQRRRAPVASARGRLPAAAR